jgi:hypothetical protein
MNGVTTGELVRVDGIQTDAAGRRWWIRGLIFHQESIGEADLASLFGKKQGITLGTHIVGRCDGQELVH